MVVKKIVIPVEIIEKLINEAKNYGIKEEITGVLFGVKYGDVARVIEFKKGENILHDRVRFLMDPEELYKFILEGEEKGLDLIGFWHTHLGDPTPSIIDVKSMMLWPVVWLIIDAITGIFTASIYDMEEEKIKSVEVKLARE